MKHSILALIATILMFSCKKADDSTPTGNNSGNNNNGTFTPPTTSYYKISGTANGSDLSLAHDDTKGGNFSVGKPFQSIEILTGNMRVFINNPGSTDIRAAIPEGGYKEFPITTNTNSSIKDSMRFELDVEGMGGNSGNFFYHASSGKVYVSKKNGKLRYTTSGVISVTGWKYPDMNNLIYNRTVEFSIQEGDQL